MRSVIKQREWLRVRHKKWPKFFFPAAPPNHGNKVEADAVVDPSTEAESDAAAYPGTKAEADAAAASIAKAEVGRNSSFSLCYFK